jgi:hypothetical protein
MSATGGSPLTVRLAWTPSPAPSGRSVRPLRLCPSRGRNAATYTRREMRSGQRAAVWVITTPPMLWPTRTASSGDSASTEQTRST